MSAFVQQPPLYKVSLTRAERIICTANEGDVGVRLEGALECDVGSGATHESNEVIYRKTWVKPGNHGTTDAMSGTNVYSGK